MSDAEDDLEIAIAERDKAEAERDAIRAEAERLRGERNAAVHQTATEITERQKSEADVTRLLISEGELRRKNDRLAAELAAVTEEAALEKLADLEHQQWIEWAKTIMDNEPISQERRDRWAGFMVPYNILPEAIKEHDRVWARRVLAAVAGMRGGG